MRRESHASFCERLGVQLLRPTHQLLVALWRYVKDGVIPEGAKMKTA